MRFTPVPKTGIHISSTERRAETVGWGVDAWLKCEYIAHRVGDVFDGVVMGVTDFGLFVELKGYYVQRLLHISELGSDYFKFQQQTLSLVGPREDDAVFAADISKELGLPFTVVKEDPHEYQRVRGISGCRLGARVLARLAPQRADPPRWSGAARAPGHRPRARAAAVSDLAAPSAPRPPRLPLEVCSRLDGP